MADATEDALAMVSDAPQMDGSVAGSMGGSSEFDMYVVLCWSAEWGDGGGLLVEDDV
jgi:hypothetical protein